MKFETQISAKEENILLAAEKLFAEKGFEGTTTREISAAASVNISMISYYFGSKEKLLDRLFEYRMKKSQDFAESIMADADMDEWEKLTAIVSSYIRRVRENRHFYSIFQVEQFTTKNQQVERLMRESKTNFLRIYETLVEDGLRRGIFSRRPNIVCLHATVIGTVFYALSGLSIYREYLGQQDNANFRDDLSEEINKHLETILKDLLGYEKK